MKEGQITLIIFFETNSFKNQYWAFSQMVLAYSKLKNVDGIEFFKSLGTGGGSGFDLKPSFSNYCWLMVWENEQLAREFLQSNLYFNSYRKRCNSVQALFLENISSHGLWSNTNPFQKVNKYTEGSKVLVLTRARIKVSKLLQFWLKVGKTVNNLYKFSALESAVGVGEFPLLQQATISIWKNKDAINKFAYEDATHKEIIKLTRKYKWYKEELFARFQIVDEMNF